MIKGEKDEIQIFFFLKLFFASIVDWRLQIITFFFSFSLSFKNGSLLNLNKKGQDNKKVNNVNVWPLLIILPFEIFNFQHYIMVETMKILSFEIIFHFYKPMLINKTTKSPLLLYISIHFNASKGQFQRLCVCVGIKILSHFFFSLISNRIRKKRKTKQ